MIVRLNKINNNFHSVQIGSILLYFSYETIIAIKDHNGLTVSENIWSRTTEQHLNLLEPDKSKRMENREFELYLDKILGKSR